MRTLLAAAAAIMVAAPATAQSVSGEFGVTTDNRSKFVSKSAGDPAAFAELVAETDDGAWYVGAESETVRASTGAEAELAFSAGWRPQVLGFDLDLHAERKVQVGARSGADDQAWEFAFDVERAVGPFDGRLRLEHSPDGTGSTDAWTYVEGRVRWAIHPRWTLDAQAGRRDYRGGEDYWGASIGAIYALTDGLDLDLHLIDTDRSGEDGEPALVATLVRSF